MSPDIIVDLSSVTDGLGVVKLLDDDGADAALVGSQNVTVSFQADLQPANKLTDASYLYEGRNYAPLAPLDTYILELFTISEMPLNASNASNASLASLLRRSASNSPTASGDGNHFTSSALSCPTVSPLPGLRR